MHFDAMTLACLAHEFRETLTAGRVQQILQVDDQSLGFEIYAQRERRYLRMSVAAAAPHVYLSTQKLRRGSDAQPPLLLLLRKYVRGAFVDQITQPNPTERVIHFGFEHPEHGITKLVLELIGRTSNVLLLGPEEQILDCMRRVRKAEGSSIRSLQPGRKYEPPRPQQKLPPLDNGDTNYYTQLTEELQSEEPLAKRLVSIIVGVSPTLAREIGWRATSSITATAQEASPVAVASALQELWAPLATGEWKPGTIHQGKTVVGFSAYQAQQTNVDEQAIWIPVALMSEAIEKFMAQKQDTPKENIQPKSIDEYAALRRAVSNDLSTARKRLTRQLKALGSDEPRPGEPEELRTKAEWLLALNSQIRPGQKSLEIDLGERALQIPLDPKKSAVEQAEQMFKRASKLERAAEFIPKRRRVLEKDLAFVDQLTGDLALAENQPELVVIREELSRARLLPIGRGKRQRPQQRADRSASQPLRFISPDGLAILVGRNARQNDKVTFDLAKAEDLWLHARGTPGAHVVVRSGGQEVSDETLHAAAQLAAYYSLQRGERAAEVAYTTRKHVTRVPRGRPGQVFVRNEQVVTVPGELPEGAMESG